MSRTSTCPTNPPLGGMFGLTTRMSTPAAFDARGGRGGGCWSRCGAEAWKTHWQCRCSKSSRGWSDLTVRADWKRTKGPHHSSGAPVQLVLFLQSHGQDVTSARIPNQPGGDSSWPARSAGRPAHELLTTPMGALPVAGRTMTPGRIVRHLRSKRLAPWGRMACTPGGSLFREPVIVGTSGSWWKGSAVDG